MMDNKGIGEELRGGDILVYTFWRGGGQAELLHDVVEGLLHFWGRRDGMGLGKGITFLMGLLGVGRGENGWVGMREGGC